MEIDVTSSAAIIAAVVGVVKGLGMPAKYSPVLAMGLAGAYVALPEGIRQTVTLAAGIGLTAAGAYSYVKPEQKKPPS